MKQLVTLITLLSILLISNLAFSRVIVVGPNEQIKSIQTAINLATDGDTIKVLSGYYEEKVVLNKSIYLIGSGYENTTIASSSNPTLDIRSGIVQWFSITSSGGDGVHMSGGEIRNCVIVGCTKNGIYTENGNSTVKNCVLINNGDNGIYVYSSNAIMNVMNCISWSNGKYGYTGWGNYYFSVNYSIGKMGRVNNYDEVYDVDPQFTSSDDYHINPNSPAWDSGNPALKDPDGSRSDMGYFGGPHAPIYPVVTKVELIPVESGGVKVKVEGRANW